MGALYQALKPLLCMAAWRRAAWAGCLLDAHDPRCGCELDAYRVVHGAWRHDVPVQHLERAIAMQEVLCENFQRHVASEGDNCSETYLRAESRE